MSTVYLKRNAAIEFVRESLLISPSTFDRMRRDPGFPEPRLLRPTSRTPVWIKSELAQYLETMPKAA